MLEKTKKGKKLSHLLSSRDRPFIMDENEEEGRELENFEVMAIFFFFFFHPSQSNFHSSDRERRRMS